MSYVRVAARNNRQTQKPSSLDKDGRAAPLKDDTPPYVTHGIRSVPGGYLVVRVYMSGEEVLSVEPCSQVDPSMAVTHGYLADCVQDEYLKQRG